MMYVVGEKKIDRDESSDSVYSSEISSEAGIRKRPKDVQKVQVEALTSSELRSFGGWPGGMPPTLVTPFTATYRLLYASFL